MAEINFTEPEDKKSEKSGFRIILTIVFLILAVAVIVYVSMRKVDEYNKLDKERN